MAEAEGQYQVYPIEPSQSRGPQFIVTTLYRTPPTRSVDFGSDRAEWFVVMAAMPLRAQIIGFKQPPGDFQGPDIDDLMRKAALAEATLEVRRYQKDNSITVGDKDGGKDLLVSDWIRGVCFKELESIRQATGCPALRKFRDIVCQLPKLAKADIALSEFDS